MTAATRTPVRLAPPAQGADLRLRVASKQAESDDVMLIRLVHPDGLRLPDWAPGAHIDLMLDNGLVRQYSLCGDRYDSSRYTIAVLREAFGRGGSAYVHDTLQLDDIVEVGGPRNNFRVVPAPVYHFIAGGIGITPIIPMIQQVEELGVPWRLLYLGRRRSSMAFVDELEKKGEHVRIRPKAEFGPVQLAEFLTGVGQADFVYGCGPSRLVTELAEASVSWPSRMRLERFEADEVQGSVRTTPFEVEIASTGQVIGVGTEESIADALAAAGHPVLTSCRRGLCGTCETGVLAGTVDHRDTILDDAERAAGDCLMVCVSRATTDRQTLDL